MSGNEFRFFLSCDINLPVTFRIERLEGVCVFHLFVKEIGIIIHRSGRSKSKSEAELRQQQEVIQ